MSCCSSLPHWDTSIQQQRKAMLQVQPPAGQGNAAPHRLEFPAPNKTHSRDPRRVQTLRAAPRDHTFPRPRAAVSATVERSVFSLAASRKVATARAWSSVRHRPTSAPAGWVSARLSTSSRSSEVAAASTPTDADKGWMFCT